VSLVYTPTQADKVRVGPVVKHDKTVSTAKDSPSTCTHGVGVPANQPAGLEYRDCVPRYRQALVKPAMPLLPIMAIFMDCPWSSSARHVRWPPASVWQATQQFARERAGKVISVLFAKCL
jgi:hypothetical protein